MQLEGKVAVVTGASKGMGAHFVDALVAAGAKVACLARDSQELQNVAARHGDNAAAFPCDVAQSDQVDAAIAATVARFGGIDLLVNNAAIFHPFLLEESTTRQVEQHVAVNLLGPIWCIRAAIPHLRARKGQIVTISSESVRLPFPYLTVYAATKAAVELLSQGLRDELRADGIRVSVLRSGSVAGGSGGQNWDADVAQRFFAKIQETGHAGFTGDLAEPTSMAKTLVAMASLPEDVNLDLVEARAARPATADSLKRSSGARHAE